VLILVHRGLVSRHVRLLSSVQFSSVQYSSVIFWCILYRNQTSCPIKLPVVVCALSFSDRT